jgi:hypothetical protein
MPLEGEPPRQLKCPRIATGEVERSERGSVYINPDLIVRGIVPKSDCIGNILTIDTEDKLCTLRNVERTTKRAGQPVNARATQTVRSYAREISDHK